MQKAQFNLRNMTGKELKEKWSQIKAFLEEKQDIADTSGNRDECDRLEEILAKMETEIPNMKDGDLPFANPIHWGGFISQGLS
jgi:hypothetical protein